MDFGFVLIIAFTAAMIATTTGFGSACNHPHTICGYGD
jgi:hypothetical protein